MKTLSHLLFATLMLAVCQATCPVFANDITDAVDKEILATTLVQKGQPAPDFTCLDTTSKQHSLSALKGKVVLLYFFASTNKASLTDLGYLESEIFQKLLAKDDFRMLAIGRGYQREELVKLGGERKITFPLVADPQQEIYQRYFTKFVPRTVIVHPDGTIAALKSGSSFDLILKLQAELARVLTAKTR